MSSTIKADVVTAQTTNGNVTLQGNGTGTVAIGDNTSVSGNLTVTGSTTASGNATIGTDAGDTRYSLNSANQYTVVIKNGGNIAGQIGGGGSDILRFSNAAGTTTLEANNGQFTYPLQPSALGFPSAAITDVTGAGSTYYSDQGNGGSGTTTYTDIFDQNGDMANGQFTAPIAGRYLVCANVEFDDVASGHTSGVFYIITSNRNYQRLCNPYQMSNVGVNCGFPMAQIVDADANDTIRWGLFVNGGSKQINILTSTNFGVHLLA